jgi:hypothetical protein
MGHSVPGGYKYGDLALQVGGSLESEAVKYGHESFGIRTMRMTALARTSSNCNPTDLSSHQGGCCMRTMIVRVKLKKSVVVSPKGLGAKTN